MRVITDQTRDAIYDPVKDGENQYFWRATVENGIVKWFDYDTENAPGGDYGTERPRTGHFCTAIFGTASGHGLREVPSIKSGQIIRDLDKDIAELTMTIANTMISPMGDSEDEFIDNDEYDVPGALSYSRGRPEIEENRWGHTETGWEGQIAPDHIMRTYEGYGIDNTVPAGFDEHMYASGVWMIDTVTLNSEGDLVIKARDLGRLLEDHIAMPRDIPWDSYPLEWSKIQSEVVQGRGPTGGDWWHPSPRTSGSHQITAKSSNDYYVGLGIEDDPNYVSAHGNVLGHRVLDPLHDGGHWLSTGQVSSESFVWWELDMDDHIDLSALRIRTFGGPFVIYISLHDGSDWIGRRKIPYEVTTEDVDLEAKIPFIHRERFEREVREDIVFNRKFENIKKIRITFTRLRQKPGAKVYPWRAGLASLAVYKGNFDDMGFDDTGETLKAVGNYRDYSDIVKWICAWSGFWWPEADAAATISYANDDDYDVIYDYENNDAVLARGRVWGSFEATGTAGVADLTADQFDKQPLLSCIQVVRDIVGFNFHIDECGGVIWRMPNLFQLGNYRTPSHLANHGRKPTYVPGADSIEILDENDILTQYSTTLDSKNLRERIAIANSDGKVGAIVHGYVPYRTGLRRIAVWTDEHFESNRQCRIAGDMVAAQQMFSFRTSVSTIPPHPAIQIDDQIRIFERISNETFYHYVTGITSTYDGATNKGSYTVNSHWLGEDPEDAWVIDKTKLDGATQNFLNSLGPID